MLLPLSLETLGLMLDIVTRYMTIKMLKTRNKIQVKVSNNQCSQLDKLRTQIWNLKNQRAKTTVSKLR